jgi:hypothetical protein
MTWRAVSAERNGRGHRDLVRKDQLDADQVSGKSGRGGVRRPVGSP